MPGISAATQGCRFADPVAMGYRARNNKKMSGMGPNFAAFTGLDNYNDRDHGDDSGLHDCRASGSAAGSGVEEPVSC